MKFYTAKRLKGAEVHTYGYMGKRGELPLSMGFAVTVCDAHGEKLFDSAEELGERDGIRDEDVKARALGQSWLDAQEGRINRAAQLMAQRRHSLLTRWDEIDADESRVHERMDELKAMAKACKADRGTLRSEAKAPGVEIQVIGRSFVVVDEPSLSEGTIGRRWRGASRAHGAEECDSIAAGVDRE